jgi:WD40 repeat protein
MMPPRRPPAFADRIGIRHDLGAFITAARASSAAIALALGDGTVRLVRPGQPDTLHTVAAHDGAALALVGDIEGEGFLSGGDDGRLARIPLEGEAETLGTWRGKWLSTLAVHEKSRLRAVAVGKELLLHGRDGGLVQALAHDSTVTGAAFDHSGQRLAVSHYGGVTLWIAYKGGWKPTRLAWGGSHIAVIWSPNSRFIVSSMQENALHGWRLSDKKDMAMRGYPAKVRSMSWAMRGRWLATSGAESAVLWPFRTDDGPMGKRPLTLGVGEEQATVVAGHPTQPLVAIGYKDGLVQLARIEEQDHLTLRNPSGDPVSALAWAQDGRMLAIGTEGGEACLLPLA